MKKNIVSKILSILLCVCIFLGCYEIPAYAEGNDFEMRACWISYLDIETYLKDLSEEDFKKRLGEMYDTVLSYGLNTVIVHVRAMGDAMYPSDYYPWSTYITTDRKPLPYDPLEIMVSLAHEKGLRFEAWINPYRLSHNHTTTAEFKATKYYEMYKKYIIEYANPQGQVCLALNPALEDARQIIMCGVCEVVSNYDVDGIHFDDYFYVVGMFDESAPWERMENVNKLIYQTYYNIKCIDKDCVFGISPAGNITNTKYQGADIEKWLSEDGYVDYIMPQIYWTDDYAWGEDVVKFFTSKCEEWLSYNKGNVKFYVGLALYRAGEESDVDRGWGKYDNNIATQYAKAYSLGYEGFALFRYAWLEDEIAENELYNLKFYMESGIVKAVGSLKKEF